MSSCGWHTQGKRHSDIEIRVSKKPVRRLIHRRFSVVHRQIREEALIRVINALSVKQRAMD
jgi:hypothetical protein